MNEILLEDLTVTWQSDTDTNTNTTTDVFCMDECDGDVIQIQSCRITPLCSAFATSSVVAQCEASPITIDSVTTSSASFAPSKCSSRRPLRSMAVYTMVRSSMLLRNSRADTPVSPLGAFERRSSGAAMHHRRGVHFGEASEETFLGRGVSSVHSSSTVSAKRAGRRIVAAAATFDTQTEVALVRIGTRGRLVSPGMLDSSRLTGSVRIFELFLLSLRREKWVDTLFWFS